MRATITGGGGDSGKCTIEVVVDTAADVEISGDTGRLITLQGQPAQWRRFQCNGRMPRNPANFRFQGIDGRGRVELIRQPSNGGVAVVRIEDPKGGTEGYTFDLEWSGGTDNYPGGPGSNSGPGYRGDGRYDPRYDRRDDYNNHSSNGRYDSRSNSRQVVSCASNDGRRNYCSADTRDGVRLLHQNSDAQCRQGSTWGYDRRGIWVDRGCRADFEVAR